VRSCERARGSRRAKIISLFIYGCCVVRGSGGGGPVQSFGRRSDSTAAARNLGSRLYGVGCPRRRPTPESTPRSAQLGSRMRRSSRRLVLTGAAKPVPGRRRSGRYPSSDSSVYSISLSSGKKKQPETDGWSSSPYKFRLSEILNRNLKLMDGAKLEKIYATYFL